MFKEYNPIKKKRLQIIDNDGKVINQKLMPKLDDKQLIKAYKDMLFARTADLMIVNYQRQGRIYTYPPNYGQEAISGAVAQIMRDDDWLVPAFREMGAYLAKGASLKELFIYFMGYEDGSLFKNAKNFLPISVPISSQLLHASGIGYEINYNNKDQIVYTFVGDGGTSEGDFHEALNFAGVWKAPVIFIVQNNQYGISTPFKMQTASDGIAIKALAYGIEGIQVDGNDFFAMYKAVEESAKHASGGNGPVLIEAVTYRKGAHTTSDDPTKYRTKEEEEKWDETDPLKRLKAYLIANKLWSEKEEEKIVPQYKKEIDRQFIEAENYGEYALEDVFKFMYTEMPQDLKNQMMEHEKFLKWKEARS
ncbi:MAG TPA: pyruvate dehydrogenase (acetyl-transferring) E1 component subunit alpha [Bacteroidales bacterium]|jgi:pyruvate dehydrogenase E1 component alpha subunit|nr:pyruvate dehydrogenase (acetyl-transferring) E1 component subunit alpha [Bacteroidales bacterium]MDY0161049.1 pyruvate dehydrogenase (acetyl-transferring) E1 component subunit alpha [Bacteroidales bacterium]HXK81976.1 pyruvate dehydrogenase (acetyl-transferring) E1 component subunit alpha [Bacteroidales bacterium]